MPFACVPCMATHKMEGTEGAFHEENHLFFQVQLENDLFTLFEKIATNVTHC